MKMRSETRSLHPVNLTALEIKEEAATHTFLLRVVIDSKVIRVYRDEQMVYEKQGESTQGFMSHSGIHVLVLHSSWGEVMMSRQFLTHQPSEHRNLATCLTSLMSGRLLIVAAVPDATVFLAQDAIQQLEAVGASRVRYLAANEAWVLVSRTPTRPLPPLTHTHTPTPSNLRPATPNLSPPTPNFEVIRGGVTYGEAAAIIRRPDSRMAGPLSLTLHVPRSSGVSCEWHGDVNMRRQREFCERYEGYVHLCSCTNPLIPAALRHSAVGIAINTLFLVLLVRQLVNLLQTPGAAQTPIVVMVDTPNMEIIHLAKLFGLDVLVHQPQGEKGTATLLNMHFRFSVHNVFNYFPDVDKAVILEDDLLLSPDFLSFFQQTSWLLDTDPTIYCVNAFSVNSYSTVAGDPTTLRRLHMFPQFGWMITRHWAQEMYKYWIPEELTGDWDWWLSSENAMQGRHALVPEVGRTYHAGAAGAHVNGWSQEQNFASMIYNTDPDVKLKDLEDMVLDRYEAKLKREILRATDLHLTDIPCRVRFPPDEVLYLHSLLLLVHSPPQPGPFRVFVASDTKSDEYGSYYLMQLCLNAYAADSREKFRNVVRFNVGGRILYIVGCPASPYCMLFPKGVTLVVPTPGLIEATEDSSSKWLMRNYPPYYHQRAHVTSPEREFAMENLVRLYYNGTMIEVI
ncbi:hypothetical protein Pmani_014075 [Petrolisthes manimaculis]|uniref:Alpha-1,3-mannosyl-glycoprotein 2-beta-N-acetylglucosaminyltransferase n=1 Tax=Petrolisthes manimaculis TaxID=1843537 RepID=A0AAE1UBG2_9EUCA|nr:hypothetical protein Pmani_014075 [Petrolisthes manimaculis]